MPLIGDRVLDNGLTVLDTEANRLDICPSEPSTYSGATGTSLGYKLNPSIDAPADRVGGGRKVTVAAISDGTVIVTDTATHYAITDTANSRLLAAAPLSASQGVTAGNTFTLTAFDIGIPDPV